MLVIDWKPTAQGQNTIPPMSDFLKISKKIRPITVNKSQQGYKFTFVSKLGGTAILKATRHRPSISGRWRFFVARGDDQSGFAATKDESRFQRRPRTSASLILVFGRPAGALVATVGCLRLWSN